MPSIIELPVGTVGYICLAALAVKATGRKIAPALERRAIAIVLTIFVVDLTYGLLAKGREGLINAPLLAVLGLATVRCEMKGSR